MPSQSLLRLVGAFLVLIFCVAFVHAWLADRRDRNRLNAELAATKQLLSAANDRQHDRDAQLSQTLAALASEKRTVRTPAQIIRDLPRELPLPAPITLQSAPLARSALTAPTSGQVSTTSAPPPSNQKAPAPQAVVPAEDLKSLYDFALDCKACQVRLAAAQDDLADEKSKTAALAKERDEALQVARGGSVLRRMRRAAKSAH